MRYMEKFLLYSKGLGTVTVSNIKKPLISLVYGRLLFQVIFKIIGKQNMCLSTIVVQ